MSWRHSYTLGVIVVGPSGAWHFRFVHDDGAKCRWSTHYFGDTDFPSIQTIFHVAAHIAIFQTIFYIWKLFPVFKFYFRFEIWHQKSNMQLHLPLGIVILAHGHHLWACSCYFAHSESKMTAETISASNYEHIFRLFTSNFLLRGISQHFGPFLPRDAMLARYMLSSCVRLSQAGTVPKWLNAGSCKKCHSPGTLVFWRQKSRRNSDEFSPNGGAI